MGCRATQGIDRAVDRQHIRASNADGAGGLGVEIEAANGHGLAERGVQISPAAIDGEVNIVHRIRNRGGNRTAGDGCAPVTRTVPSAATSSRPEMFINGGGAHIKSDFFGIRNVEREVISDSCVQDDHIGCQLKIASIGDGG